MSDAVVDQAEEVTLDDVLAELRETRAEVKDQRETLEAVRNQLGSLVIAISRTNREELNVAENGLRRWAEAFLAELDFRLAPTAPAGRRGKMDGDECGRVLSWFDANRDEWRGTPQKKTIYRWLRNEADVRWETLEAAWESVGRTRDELEGLVRGEGSAS